MAFFTNFFNSILGGASRRGYYANYMGQPSAEFVSVEGNEIALFNEVPQLRLVIERRATMMSNVVFEEWKDGKLVNDSEIVSRLNNPNALQSRSEFFAQREAQMCLFGNAFTYNHKGSALAAVPSAMWNLPTGELEIMRTGKMFRQTEKDEIIRGVKIFSGRNQEDSFIYSDLWHSNMITIDDPLMGVSPLLSLKMPLSNIKEAYKYRNVIMAEKGAIGILSNEFKEGSGGFPLTNGERKRVEESYQRNYGTSDQKSKIIMSQANLKWQPMSYPTKDMMLFEEVSDDFRTIIDMYGLNRNIFSFESGSTFSNVFEGLKMAYQDTIIPVMKTYARELSEQNGLDWEGNHYIKASFDHIPVLAEDEGKQSDILKKKAETADKLIASGVMSVEEIRNSGMFTELFEALEESI